MTPERRREHGRSAVSNRADLLPSTDLRSSSARRHRDLVRAFTLDCDPTGGDNLTEAKRQLIRRAAALAFAEETLEARVVAGGSPEFQKEANGLTVHAQEAIHCYLSQMRATIDDPAEVLRLTRKICRCQYRRQAERFAVRWGLA
jgi:hypothetical protein